MNAVDAANQSLPLFTSVSDFSATSPIVPMFVGSNLGAPSVDHLGIARHLTYNPTPIPYLLSDSERTFASQLNHNYSSVFEAALMKMLLQQQATTSVLERQQSPQYCTQTLTLPTTPVSAFSVSPAHMSLLDTTDQVNTKAFYRCAQCGLATQDKIELHMHMVREHSGLTSLPVHPNLYTSPQQFRADGPTLDRFLNMDSSYHLNSQNVNLWATQPDFSCLTSSFVRLPSRLCQKKETCASVSDSSVSPSVSDLVRCELCGKYLSRSKPLSSLLNHAKRHNVIKQFICTECPYGSSEAAHVRNHMKLRHRIIGRVPRDNRNPMLQDAWMRITVRCFPSMSRELSRFRFKNFRKKGQGANSVVSMATEDDDDNSDSFLIGQ